ncbi:hypothetical protein ACFLWX_03595 [Chloroflexota bacterium]
MPDWASNLLVPGQEQIKSEIQEIVGEIEKLQSEHSSRVAKNDDLVRWKWLLYETGKHRLEPVVRDALVLLGFVVETQNDKDSDGLVKSEFGSALLEIEGADETVKIGKISQLIRNIGNYISKNEEPVGGILLDNPFRGEPLENRPPKNNQKQLFSKELIETAVMQSITVILSTDLYKIVCQILENKLTNEDKKLLRQRILEGKGLVTLSEYIQ